MIPFAKAHACGNDFLVVEAQHVSDLALAESTQRLCARNTGVGADGVEYLDWTGDSSSRIHLYNADGSTAEISGNGTRCVAAYMAHKKHLTGEAVVSIETDAGTRECRVLQVHGSRYKIASAMGVPAVIAAGVALNESQMAGAIVSTGNPHFVIFVEDDGFSVGGRGWEQIGREICRHADFPHQTNVEFVHIVNPSEIDIRIFERGVGATTSSGTGTCAAAAATIVLRRGERRLAVNAPGGTQQIHWPGNDSEIVLTGPAEIICFGEAFQ